MSNVYSDPLVESSSSSRKRKEISSLDEEDLVLRDDHRRNGRTGRGEKGRGVKFEHGNLNFAIRIMGSDLRICYNFVIVQGRQSGPSAGYDELSSDADAESANVLLVADDIEKHDPLVESIKDFVFAREEFEREVQKWRDVGKDDSLIFYEPIQEILELKDAKILALKLALSSGDIKNEIEDCLMKIVQADVENVVITTTTRRLTAGPLCEIKQKLHQKNLPLQDMQATQKQDENLETKENLKSLQNRVCKFTSCFMVQFILLFVTIYLKFSSQKKKMEIVPT